MLLRTHLKSFPTDVAAIRMLAEVAARLRRYGDAETLLERCLELAPSFTAARHNYAVVLHRQNKLIEALREVDTVLAAEPAQPGYRQPESRHPGAHRRAGWRHRDLRARVGGLSRGRRRSG